MHLQRQLRMLCQLPIVRVVHLAQENMAGHMPEKPRDKLINEMEQTMEEGSFCPQGSGGGCNQ